MVVDYGAVCRIILNDEIKAGNTVQFFGDAEVSIGRINKVFSTEFGIVEALSRWKNVTDECISRKCFDIMGDNKGIGSECLCVTIDDNCIRGECLCLCCFY